MNSAYTIRKASFFKRSAAFLFDLIIAFVLFIGADQFVTHPIVNSAFDYDAVEEAYNQKLVDYGIGHFDEKTGDFVLNEMPKDGYDFTEFNKDEGAVEIQSKLSSLNLFTITMDFALSGFIVFCLLPLILKNGQTLGKKLMRLALVSTNEVRVRGWNVFARWAVGIFAFETMINLFFVTFFIIPVPLIVSVIMAMVTKKGMALHDYIGGTIVVDLNNTVILDTVEERRNRILEEKEAFDAIQKKKFISQKEIEKGGM